MSNKSTRLIAAFAALLVSVGLVRDASAQCCGQPVTSFYAPVTTSYYSGWYPGYWLNRASARMFGSTTYVTSYAPVVTASYAPACPTCTANFAPTCSTCTASYAPSCSTCTASFAPTCSSCTASYAPSCSTCSSAYTTSYAPSCGCETCGASCPSSCGCSSCSAGTTVTQTSYQQAAPPCSNCSASAPTSTPTPAANAAAPTSTYAQPQAPSLAPSTPAAPAGATGTTGSAGTTSDATGAAAPATTVQRPAETPAPAATQPQPEPQPESKDNSTDPYYVPKKENATYFEAPKLFNPNDRTAKRAVLAPVHTAVYQQPVSYAKTPGAAPRATAVAAQPKPEVITWSSASSK